MQSDGRNDKEAHEDCINKQDEKDDTHSTLSEVHLKIGDHANELQKYAGDCILRHVANGAIVKYVVRRYVYASADETVEPLECIVEHFITRYWCCARIKVA